MRTTVQRQKYEVDNSLELAIKYYSLLSVLNNLSLSKRQIQLLAFTATRGNISSGGSKEQFIELYSSSKDSIGNIIHKLSQMGLLIKENKKIVVRKEISMDFTNNIILQITLNAKR